nr:glutamate--trna ligase, mitochondrial [Quercus suber]
MLNTIGRRSISTAHGSRGWICEPCLRAGTGATRRTFTQRSSGDRTSSFARRPVAPISIKQRQYATVWVRETTRNHNLPATPARTRFAPSPTGRLHIGGLRTALYSYLLAKKTGGQFILRIEDTDQKRLVPGAEQSLIDDLRWAGLEWDEGPEKGGNFGPYKQSERVDIYQTHAKKLLDVGKAYRCFCQPKAADEKTEEFVTSGCYQDCSEISREHSKAFAGSGQTPFTIRLKQVPSTKGSAKTEYPDLVFGNIPRLKTQAGQDAILIKSDGTPTYHFANVVDDHLMRITHVIRGAEWMASTPLHYDLYRAFGWTPPTFAHVPLLTDMKGAKLSKRNSANIATDLDTVRQQQGVLPEELSNFLLFLGWSNPGKSDFMTMGDMIAKFDLKFTKGDVKLSYDKLPYLGRKHVSRHCYVAQQTGSLEPLQEDLGRLTPLITAQYPQISEQYPSPAELKSYVAKVLIADKDMWKNPQTFVEENCYFWTFDASRVPAEPQTFGREPNTVPYSTIAEATQDLLENFDFKQEFRSALYIKPQQIVPEEKPSLKLEGAAAKITAAIEYTGWRLAFPNAAEQDLPFTDEPIDADAYAKHFDGNETSLQRKKAMSAAVYQHLRQKISYGLRGPKTGLVLEILGYEECCRRLGYQARGPGW